MQDESLEKSPSKTSDVLKPHIYFDTERWRWVCLRDWNLKRTYLSEAPSWKLLLVPEEEREIGPNDHNLFIQEDVHQGWREFCIETWYYLPGDKEGWYLQGWYCVPTKSGLAIFVH